MFLKFLRTRNKLYWVAIISFISITLINQVIIQLILHKKKSNIHVVNLAGRQRMLSQKIVKLYYQGLAGEDHLQELKQLCEEWNTVHWALQNGSESLELPVLENEEIKALFAQINPVQVGIYDSIKIIKNPESMASSLPSIRSNEEKFLPLMEKIVLAFEQSELPFQNLIIFELVLALIAILVQVFEIVVIFIPLFEKMRKQNDSLREIAFDHSHKVRSPVCTIRGLVNLIDVDSLDKENLELFKRLEKSTLELDKITSDIVGKTNDI